MATQKGRNWSSGDIVTAANLSSIERGVSAVAEEYTPTTWANGDTVTAAALNNIEQGIANAGGSGLDIPHLEVKVINNSGNSNYEYNIIQGAAGLMYVSSGGYVYASGDAASLEEEIEADSEKTILFFYGSSSAYFDAPDLSTFVYSDLVNVESNYEEGYITFNIEDTSANASMTITISQSQGGGLS